MCFINDFIEREIKNMKQFIDKISVRVAIIFVDHLYYYIYEHGSG